ncbi:MAG TPA: glycerophosphodiester phosphodiesterase family protein [Sporichthyaceae bacterium]|jgi:glycerophosphoryl diester phosphodiesterase|nr:glycerophosphodiester phosphodiesterase family protein [Sporichthyaceae bacterium]
MRRIGRFAWSVRGGVAALVAGTAAITTAGLPFHAGHAVAATTPVAPAAAPAAVRPASTNSTAVGTSGVAVVAHRGGEIDTPESTIAAFANAIQQGSQGIVFDVRYTSDGVPVVMHDATLDRTTNCTGTVSDYTLAKLEKCNANDGFKNFGFQAVPTLNEALAYITAHSSTVKIYIHTKTVANTHQAAVVVAAVKQYHLDQGTRTTLLADSATLLRRLKAAGGKRLGLVFHGYDKHWAVAQTTYPVLYSWDATLTASDIATVAKQGRQLIASAGHPQSLNTLLALGAHDVAVDDLDASMQHLA